MTRNAGAEDHMKREPYPADRVARRGRERKDLLGPNSEIGRRLREYYDEIVSEAVPDRFAELLGQLEKAESAGKKKPADDPTE
jgi:hypothetical protein